jgi:predicted methyltransferase
LGIKGVTIKNGETVEVSVDLSKGKIDFIVHNIPKLTVTVNDYKILKQANR